MRSYSNTAIPTALSSNIDDDDTTLPVVSTAGLPSPPFTIALNQGTSDEEICLVEGMTANSLTSVTRGYDDTTARAATAGDDVRHVVIALDYREAAEHRESETLAHLPIGFGPVSWLRDTLPTGWLWCDGSAVSRSTYADLFALFGTTFGAGNGTTTFNLPDVRGRTLIGLDNLGGTPANRVTDPAADAIGGSGGVASVTLGISQVPIHSHGESEHIHRYPAAVTATGVLGSPAELYSPAQDELPTVSSTGPPSGAATSPAGGGQAHTNMPPWVATPWIVRGL